MIKNLYIILFIKFIIVLPYLSLGQDTSFDEMKICFKMGNSSDLSTYLDNLVEINLNGKKSMYSKSQATYILKDFFEKNPANNFEYIHQGKSQKGLTYSIGKYTSELDTYRLLMRMKDVDGKVKIYNLDINKE